MKNNIGEAALTPAKAGEWGSKPAVLSEKVVSQPYSLLKAASRKQSLKKSPRSATCSILQEALRGEHLGGTCCKSSCARSLLRLRTSFLIHVGFFVVSSAALPFTWEIGNKSPLWYLPPLADHEQAGNDVWASNDTWSVQPWPVLFFLCSVLFVDSGGSDGQRLTLL